jgi:murein DD-endopeptidase MepM/ murein hydrolase activator NlpD
MAVEVESLTYPSRRLSVRVAVIIAAVLANCGCFSAPAPSLPARTSIAPTTHTTHTVASGETVYHIAHAYGVSPERLMKANGLGDPRELRLGQTLVIPDRGFATASVLGLSEEWAPARADREFAWPVAAGVVSSPFGVRNGVMHEGVDIAAPAGTPVNAADDGTIIFSGRLNGYGNVIIVQHSGGYATVYAHNQRNLVSNNQRVSRGQEIAEIGTSGRATGPILHFEVRRDNHAQNPLAYLPVPQPAGGISFARNSGS